ncbi:ectonucleotide pyrophosphatase/phosphodiesterase [Natronogracilivirga saccharolytica]|uniref:Alkaline phosphatase family protein n=1 Tax=Natronogracilivirga saccharolytica TaxID=2812953 RepID=A0A8J7UVX7_9BACT|nr:ectonucleotide pyrophosphatase/phosphodiesterase [Natronogracilivirga saccharolytica]MBP3191619.1 alkaline phosphatase family protein [Natronogracilivirga saccharolytica]
MKFFSAALIAFLVIAALGIKSRLFELSDNTFPEPNRLILISIDGLHPDYLSRAHTPVLDSLASGGVIAENLIPIFPTKTFPNHYSIATGRYSENTGIIANNMYDPVLDASFSLSDRNAVTNPDWYGGEPVWVTAEIQGITSATIFWPGSEAPIKDTQATYWLSYNQDMPHQDRVDSLIHWMTLPDNEYSLLNTLYFSIVDSYGHWFGPDSDSVTAALEKTDSTLDYLISELDKHGLRESSNIIIVSDHGMAATSEDRVIMLDDIISLGDAEVRDWDPVAMIQPLQNSTEQIYRALKNSQENYKVFRKENIPDRFHFKNHHRVPEIIVIADVGYTITSRDRMESFGITSGTHGYDNLAYEMQAFFLAHGPDFKTGKTIRAFELVHIYELMCQLLSIEPYENDGDSDKLKHILR